MVGVLLILSLMPFAAADRLAQLCGNAGNYTANGTYQSNLGFLAATLPNNASSSPELFATATAGHVPDVVFALTLCRGDVNVTACSDCVATSFQDAQKMCPYDKGATIFYDDCLLRFSNDSFLIPANITEDSTLLQKWNPLNTTGDVHEVLMETAKKAATTTRRFATGFMDSSSITIPTLYSLAQCTPDLSADDCLACLQRIIGMMNSTTYVRYGGRILVVRCNFRFEAFMFYNGEPMLRIKSSGAPAPVPAPTVPTKMRSSD